MAIKQKSKEEADREIEIALLEKAVERAEGRGQKDTSYHTQLARLKNPPHPGNVLTGAKETKEIKE